MATRSVRALQVAVGICGLVPVGAGLAGMLIGPRLAEPGASASLADAVSLDSHFRYLSGLLLGIGIAFWCLIPDIARRRAAFGLLTFVVVCGGAGRLLGIVLGSVPSPPMLFGLGMELLVTPLLWLWLTRLATRFTP